MEIQRLAKHALIEAYNNHKITVVTGPKAVGKTSLVRSTFHDMPYVSLANTDTINAINSDIKSFFGNYINGLIIDDVYDLPLLFEHLQSITQQNPNAKFILIASQTLSLDTIPQSFKTVKVLPFAINEVAQIGYIQVPISFSGYPDAYSHSVKKDEFYTDLLAKLEQDAKKQFGDLSDNVLFHGTFYNVLTVLSTYACKRIDTDDICKQLKMTKDVLECWLNFLKRSFIIFFLSAHKSAAPAKLYFYDSELLHFILTKSKDDDRGHFPPVVGFEGLLTPGSEYCNTLWENTTVGNAVKLFANTNIDVCYLVDKYGYEVDLMIPANDSYKKDVFIKLAPAGFYTKNAEFFKHLDGKVFVYVFEGNKLIKNKGVIPVDYLGLWNYLDELFPTKTLAFAN